ncbi:MAG: hypothetical protein L0241_05085 [Planctomycetia bacterium]|nr:hypothetical protein [Planctomycetia bacterium]
MFEQILPWAGLVVVLFLCLPISPIQKLILEVSTWSLRLGMIGLLAAGVYLWFRPSELPSGVSGVLADFPRLLSLLPDPGSPAFGLCAACLVVTVFVPVLAVLDVSRKLAGRLCQLRALTASPVKPQAARSAEPVLPTADEVAEEGVPILRPIERRTAAAAIASAAPRPAR